MNGGGLECSKHTSTSCCAACTGIVCRVLPSLYLSHHPVLTQGTCSDNEAVIKNVAQCQRPTPPRSDSSQAQRRGPVDGSALKKEIEKAWKMVDASREGRPAPGTIQQLKLEISNLTRLVERGGRHVPG
jgi:hypothetical protein